MAARKFGKDKKDKSHKTERVARADNDDDRKRAIDLAVSTIEKQFGKGSILTMNGDGIDYTIGMFSSGSPSIDIALGIGRFAKLGAAIVDADAAGAQQLFGAPPRGDTGGGDDLLQPDDARGRAHGR